MKKLVNYIFKQLGYKIIRTERRSVKTDRLKLHETETGKYFLPVDAVEDHVASSIRNNKVFDLEVVDCVKNFIADGSVVLDIGANFGQMTVIFSKVVGDNGKVFSFEADDFICEILKKNIQVNNCNNVEVIFGAVHDIDKSILTFPTQDFIKYGAYGSYGIDYKNKQTGRQVESLTIDGLGIKEKIDFMKIDIQGGDLHAMKGAVNTINKNMMPILFEFEYSLQDDLSLSFQEYIDFVHSIGYVFAKVINGQNYLIVPKN
jgi:FkbM family methyltransferase